MVGIRNARRAKVFSRNSGNYAKCSDLSLRRRGGPAATGWLGWIPVRMIGGFMPFRGRRRDGNVGNLVSAVSSLMGLSEGMRKQKRRTPLTKHYESLSF